MLPCLHNSFLIIFKMILLCVYIYIYVYMCAIVHMEVRGQDCRVGFILSPLCEVKGHNLYCQAHSKHWTCWAINILICVSDRWWVFICMDRQIGNKWVHRYLMLYHNYITEMEMYRKGSDCSYIEEVGKIWNWKLKWSESQKVNGSFPDPSERGKQQRHLIALRCSNHWGWTHKQYMNIFVLLCFGWNLLNFLQCFPNMIVY